MRQIRRITFREIKSSFGRFLAIFAIIALGVGFFAGLKVARESMVTAVKSYLDRHAFYDLRLLSTLGFEAGEAELLLGQRDVEAAEGSVSMDVLYRMEDGRQGVLKVHSLTETVNAVELLKGRLPQNSDECVVDCNLFGEDAIGSRVYLAEDNEEETLESFSHSAYTIVGTVQSPLYIQYERGNTSLGTGRVDGFAYLAPEGFDTDYVTEIYVRFAQDNELYGEGYKSYIAEKKPLWEELAAAAASERHGALLADAQGELADAREELEDERARGERELADAGKKLEDGRKELAEGESALADAERELADAGETLREKEGELADGRRTLAEKELELADGEEQLARGEKEWKENDDLVNSEWSALTQQKAQLSQQKAALEEQSARLEEQSALLAQQAAGLEAERERLNQAVAAGLISPQEFEAAMGQLAAGEGQLAAAGQQLEAGRREIEEGRKQLSYYENLISEGESQLREADAELAEARRELDAAAGELAEGREALEEARRELARGEQAIADGRRELADGEKTLEEKRAELADAKVTLADGEREYAEAEREFEEGIAGGERELADAEKKLADLKSPDTYVLGRDTNVGYVCFENDSGIVDGIANIFPIFFFLVAALVCITTMNRMVEEQRTQIGVLKALGYSGGAIMSKYVIYSGLAAALGCVFGFFLGTWGFPAIIWHTYGIMYRAGSIVYVFDAWLAAVSAAGALLCSVGAAWLSCRVELRVNAALLMRPKAPRAGKRVFLERVGFLWKRLSFLKKVSVRNIFRYKKRLFMMALGIGGCTALLVTGFGIDDSISNVAGQQFGEIQIYDIGVTFQDAADEEFGRDPRALFVPGVEDALLVTEKSMDAVSDRGIRSVTLVAGDGERMPAFTDMHTGSGEPIPYPRAGEGMVTRRFAEQNNIKVGASLTLTDTDRRPVTVTVSGIMENFLNNYVFICEDTWREAFGTEPERKTAYVNLAPEADAHQVSAALMKLEGAANVTVNADTLERIGGMMDSLNIIVVVVILCAAGLAFIVLYNLTNINIAERVREIATVKVLGFYRKETASYVFRENVLLSLFGMAVGLVMGRFLHAYVMNEIRIDMIAFDVRIRPVSYLYSGLLTMAFTWFVNKFMERKLEKISMTESLKSVD